MASTTDSGVSILVKMCEDGLKNGTISDEMKKWYDGYLAEKAEQAIHLKQENDRFARRDKYEAFGYNSYFNGVWFPPSCYGDSGEVIVLSGCSPTDMIFCNSNSFDDWNRKFINGEVSDENIHVISKLEARKMWLKHLGIYDAAMKIPDTERFVMMASYYESPYERDSFLNGWRYGVIDLLTGSVAYPGGICKTQLFEECKDIFAANDNKDDERRFNAILGEFNFFHLDTYKFITIPFEHFKNGTYDEFVRNNTTEANDIFFHHEVLMRKYGFMPLSKPTQSK